MAKPKAHDYIFKLIVIGDTGVGKSCLISRFCNSVFSTNYEPTIGVEFEICTIDLDGKRIKLQIWDIAGQQRFRTITSAHYRGALGIMIVYDVSNEKSFDNITNWILNTEAHATTGVERMLVGNKCNTRERKVEREKSENFAREYGLPLFETSAEENINVEEAFRFLAKVLKDKHDRTSDPPQHTDLPLSKPSPKDKLRQSFRSSCSLM